jgi:hypothetical protein
VREPIRIGDHRGFRYAELDPALLERLPRWLAEQSVAEGHALKPGRVYRWKDVVIKFGIPERHWRNVLRRSRSLRSADLYEALLPLPTPKPYLALEHRVHGRVERSVLVSEFVPGRMLNDIWRDDPRGVAAFPLFLAGMHSRRIFHGDLNLDNALWTGTEWYLIDLESVRHWAHGFFPRKFCEVAWAHALFRLELLKLAGASEVRPLFDVYWPRAHMPGDAEAVWRRIVERSRTRP